MRQLAGLVILSVILAACASAKPQPTPGSFNIQTNDRGKVNAWSLCDPRNNNLLYFTDQGTPPTVVVGGCLGQNASPQPEPKPAPLPPAPSGVSIPIQVPQGKVGATVQCTWTGSAWSCPFPSSP